LAHALKAAFAISAALAVAGCNNSSSTTKTVPPPAPEPSQLYFAPAMSSGDLSTYAIDHTANTFVRSTYGASGATITDSGTISTLPNGITSLAATYILGNNGPASLPQPITGGWAVEIPNEASLVELDTPATQTSQGYTIPAANYFTPVVPTQDCPTISTAETFQFVTIPERLASANSTGITLGAWNPQLETAYGSVQVATTTAAGETSVAFSSVSQFTLPSANGGTPGSPFIAPPSGATQVCASTYYGQVVSVPGSDVITNPGGAETISAAATIGIGPSGFLVEDSGSSTVTGQPYDNLLGAGYGAVGLPQPSSDPTSSLVGGQFQGFVYSPGVAPGGFTDISSFGGYASQQTSCSTLLSQLTSASLTPSANTIYGGEFTLNATTPNPTGTGNCDLAIDLGTPGSSSNGLYTSATVYVGASFPQNGLGQAYSFPAVAVGGQISGKNALFLIAADTTGSPNRAWGIYLLQSN
jgi:hypothetical protein